MPLRLCPFAKAADRGANFWLARRNGGALDATLIIGDSQIFLCIMNYKLVE
jgi:hypothetical protein